MTKAVTPFFLIAMRHESLCAHSRKLRYNTGMEPQQLTAHVVHFQEWGTAEVVVEEANGDRYPVSCNCLPDRTEIGGEDHVLQYLNARYGPGYFSFTVRQAVLDSKP